MRRFRARYDHFTRHAHTLPTMLAAALGASSRAEGAGGESATWREAVRKTAAVDLADLTDPDSARVRAAIRGPAPPLPPGLAVPPGLGHGLGQAGGGAGRSRSHDGHSQSPSGIANSGAHGPEAVAACRVQIARRTPATSQGMRPSSGTSAKPPYRSRRACGVWGVRRRRGVEALHETRGAGARVPRASRTVSQMVVGAG